MCGHDDAHRARIALFHKCYRKHSTVNIILINKLILWILPFYYSFFMLRVLMSLNLVTLFHTTYRQQRRAWALAAPQEWLSTWNLATFSCFSVDYLTSTGPSSYPMAVSFPSEAEETKDLLERLMEMEVGCIHPGLLPIHWVLQKSRWVATIFKEKKKVSILPWSVLFLWPLLWAFLGWFQPACHCLGVRAAYSSGKFLKVGLAFVTSWAVGAGTVSNCYPSLRSRFLSSRACSTLWRTRLAWWLVHFVLLFILLLCSVPASASAQHRCCPSTQDVSGHGWPLGCLYQAGSGLCFLSCFMLSVAGCVTWVTQRWHPEAPTTFGGFVFVSQLPPSSEACQMKWTVTESSYK